MSETEQPKDPSHMLLEEIADIIESKEAERTSDVWAASPVSYERGLACLKAKRIIALVKPTIQPKCDYCGSAGLGHEAGCRAPDESGRIENKQAFDGSQLCECGDTYAAHGICGACGKCSGFKPK